MPFNPAAGTAFESAKPAPYVRCRTAQPKTGGYCHQMNFSLRIFLRQQQEQSNMNKDQVEGVAKTVAGKIQEEAGKLVGSKEQQVKGLTKQISGKAQKGVGDAVKVLERFNKG
jgi:uncharacterized protein YjbJ (UPF0337 family)